jgi:NCK-associated protein 1
MEFPAQHRYSIAFPMVCAHFMQATHELCPEEVRHCHLLHSEHAFTLPLQRHSIGTTSSQYAHWFLKEMSEEVNQVITAISEEQTMLADKVIDLIPCPTVVLNCVV